MMTIPLSFSFTIYTFCKENVIHEIQPPYK